MELGIPYCNIIYHPNAAVNPHMSSECLFGMLLMIKQWKIQKIVLLGQCFASQRYAHTPPP